jgi:signal transduction histidine kinase
VAAEGREDDEAPAAAEEDGVRPEDSDARPEDASEEANDLVEKIGRFNIRVVKDASENAAAMANELSNPRTYVRGFFEVVDETFDPHEEPEMKAEADEASLARADLDRPEPERKLREVRLHWHAAPVPAALPGGADRAPACPLCRRTGP